MLQKVIDALEKECAKNTENPMYEEITKKLIAECEANSQVLAKMAEAITNKKTVGGAIEAMKKIAKSRAVGGCAYISPEEGFEIIHKYFGISAAKSEGEIVALEDLL